MSMLDSERVWILGLLVFWGDLSMPLEPVNGIDACYYVIGHLLIHFFSCNVCGRVPGILASAQDALDGYCCCTINPSTKMKF